MTEFFVGLDLGQARDYTALAILERSETLGDRDAVSWERRKVVACRVRHLERVPMGTPYPDVVTRVAEVVASLRRSGRCQLMVDATGVGPPVVDMLRREDLDCWLRPVKVTSGDSESEKDGYYRVPKRDLIVGLQVMLQSGKLKFATGLPWGDAFLKEITEMRVKVTGEGHEQFGAWREGTHDDLVFAVALAGWGADRWVTQDMFGRRRLI